MFATVFLSYGLQWLLWRATFRKFFNDRWKLVHATNAERLARGFVRMRGVYIKLGQVISVMGAFLPSAYGTALRRLQDAVPARSLGEMTSRLRPVWGEDYQRHFRELAPEALAAASLAQVHRGTTQDGEEVAVKILYPGIEALVRRDLFVIGLVVPVVHTVFGFRKMGTVLEQLTAMLQHELDYEHERQNIQRMRAIFEAKPQVTIPRVVDSLSGPGVLVMSYEHGTKLDKASLDEAGIDSEAVAKVLVDAYFTMLFEHRLFHVDPHPGNFLARPGNVLVILDHGAVEAVSVELVSGIKTVVMGGVTRDPDTVMRGVREMGFVAEGGDEELINQIGREYLGMLGQLRIKNFAEVDPETVVKLTGAKHIKGKMRRIAGSLRYPEGYFYVERAIALLFGLVGQLSPDKGLLGIAAPMAGKVMLRSFPRRPPRTPS